LLNALNTSALVPGVAETLQALLPAVEAASRRLSPVGSLQRARQTLSRLHTEPKTVS